MRKKLTTATRLPHLESALAALPLTEQETQTLEDPCHPHEVRGYE